MSRVVKSLLWLVGCSSVGYGLLLLTKPDERIVKEKYPDIYTSDSMKHKQLIVDTLKSAATTNVPLYRQSTEDIKKELKADKKH